MNHRNKTMQDLVDALKNKDLPPADQLVQVTELLKQVPQNYAHFFNELESLCVEESRDPHCHSLSGKTTLLFAVDIATQTGNLKIVETLLNAKADPNFPGQGESYPISAAASKGNDKIVKLLLDAKANPNAQDTANTSALMETKSIVCAKLLLDAKADVNIVSYFKITALSEAYQRADHPMVKLLMSAKVSAQSFSFLLLSACKKGDVECVKTCLEAKADTSVVDYGDTTALMYAARSGNIECVKRLLAANADVNLGNTVDCNPLYEAAKSGFPAIISVLLEAKANVIKMPPPPGRYMTTCSPLAEAAKGRGNLESVRLLLNANADPNFIHSYLNMEEKSPLMHAASSGNQDVIVELIKAKASVNYISYYGHTPLSMTAFSTVSESIPIITLLIDKNADVNIKAYSGCTPLHRVAEHGKSEQVLKLIEAKAKIDEVDNNRKTAFDYALSAKNLDTLATLASYTKITSPNAVYDFLYRVDLREPNALIVLKVLCEQQNKLKQETTQHQRNNGFHNKAFIGDKYLDNLNYILMQLTQLKDLYKEIADAQQRQGIVPWRGYAPLHGLISSYLTFSLKDHISEPLQMSLDPVFCARLDQLISEAKTLQGKLGVAEEPKSDPKPLPDSNRPV